MEYIGVALSETLDSKREGVTISTQKGIVKVILSTHTVQWPIRAVEISQGGTGNQLLYLSNKDDKSVTFYTRDKALLKDPYLLENPSIATISKTLTKKASVQKMGYAVLILAIFSLPAVLYFSKPYFAQVATDAIPAEYEVSIGDKLFETIKLQYRVIEDSSIAAKLDSLFAPIIHVADYPEVTFKFYICEDPSLNAFALPGGHVVINTGVINQSERIEEVMGVVAHEIAHVTKRHHLRGVIDKLGTFVLFQGVFGGDAGIIGSMGESAGQLSSLFYSRSFENEADATAHAYLTGAGIDPSGMTDFFGHILAQQQQQDTLLGKEASGVLNTIGSYISTHPETAERIKTLEGLSAQSDQAYSPVAYSIEELRALVDNSIH